MDAQLLPVSASTQRLLASHSADAGLKADTHWPGDNELVFFVEVPACSIAPWHESAAHVAHYLELIVWQLHWAVGVCRHPVDPV